ncbi:MAG: DUF6691 family protein [Pseudomonadales bacterium]|jgi:uncharacterized membrane protein YedE/YeeE|nr:DUF6691 family protein [Pseudomonadales bacterium]
MTDQRAALAALLAGVLFGIGLAVSQMVDPEKVLAFLDVAAVADGAWDPSLVLVLCAAVGTNLVGYRLVLRRPAPRFAERFFLPTRSDVDPRLVGGSALFGIGWGLAGYCPGPALAALSHGSLDALWFTGAMLVGMFAFQKTESEGTPAAAR